MRGWSRRSGPLQQVGRVEHRSTLYASNNDDIILSIHRAR